MKLTATLTTEELRGLAQSLIPLRVDLRAEPDDDPRWLDVDELFEAQMIADQGLSLAARAIVRWPERALFDEFRTQRVELLLVPRLEPSPEGVALAVHLRFGALDVAWMPDFVEQAVVDAINARLAQSSAELRWNMSGTLTFAFDEPGEQSNIERICFGLPNAAPTVTADGVRVEGEMTIGLRRSSPETMAQRLH
ncbi:MAG TPA: hypothetical protein VM869_12080 [Enhygromyxa sp.]|nr:hypothetical protein [Enhygromyxa sp.]